MRQPTDTRPLLQVSNAQIHSVVGRPLFKGLQWSMGVEQVALIGRNGVGKSTLLSHLLGEHDPRSGRIQRRGRWHVVRQTLDPEEWPMLSRFALRELTRASQNKRLSFPLPPAAYALSDAGWDGGAASDGQHRQMALWFAFAAQPDMLVLDEPTEALDRAGRKWLIDVLSTWKGGLIVVSHDRALLRLFSDFIALSEAGGRYVQGSFEECVSTLKEEQRRHEKKYVQGLRVLADKEWHHARVCRRRARKKRLGRIHELGRCPSKALLNTNRSYAQESQGRAANIRHDRQEKARDWARSMRRALDTRLEFVLEPPSLPPVSGAPTIQLEQVSCRFAERELFSGISGAWERERMAVVGPNGSGKTTLLRMMAGALQPTSGRVARQHAKIGWIAQHALNWMCEESLVEQLVFSGNEELASLDDIASLLVAHQFPLALAQRPMASLSPGERLRAALICLYTQRPHVECLVLDEPTCSLDFLGVESLVSHLASWPGGLIVASHDVGFLEDIGVKHRLSLPEGEVVFE